MSSSPPLKDWTPLPEELEDLPRMGFVRRPAATSEEFERTDVVFGATSVADAIRRSGKARFKPRKNT